MRSRPLPRCRRAALCAAAMPAVISILTAPAGCGTDPVQSVMLTLGFQSSPDFIESRANEQFATAETIAWSGEADAVIAGTIDSPGDVDVYLLGPLEPGDRVVVDVAAALGLSAAAALFDEAHNALIISDAGFAGGAFGSPYIDFVARRATAACYLVISSDPRDPSTGGYNVHLLRQTGQPIPAPHAQVVVLEFNGAAGVSVGTRSGVNVPPFDAASISPVFAGQTEQIKARLLETVRRDFWGYDVQIFTSDDPVLPDGPHSTVYFGTYNQYLLGLADNVDPYNSLDGQNAIIFTDTFALFMPLDPSPDEMGVALANVTSHEIGHLLGLNHTADPLGIMDITATAFELLQDQTFRRSPLEPSIFLLGWQDATALLLDAVGPAPEAKRFPSRLPAMKTPSPSVLAWRREAGNVVLTKSLFAACGACSGSH